LQLGEKDEAQAHAGESTSCVVVVAADCVPDGGEPADVAHICHHHCPVAPAQRMAFVSGNFSQAGDKLFFDRVATLDSLTCAPLTEPPAA
jgi:hypothetical protein